MPIYEYQCADCGQRIERLQRIDDPPPGPCDVCSGSMQRQVSAPAFQFKGTGWYVTDYADRKGPESKDGAVNGSSAEAGGSADASPKDSNSASESSKADGGSGSTKAKAEPPAAKTVKASD